MLASSRGLVFFGNSWAGRINFPSSTLKLAVSDYGLHFRYLRIHFFFGDQYYILNRTLNSFYFYFFIIKYFIII